MSAILLTVAYDGTPFAGWAPQRNARTVAGELLGAIQAMDPSAGELRGASRTDAGVHARGQLATFASSRDIDPRGWALGLSAHLPAEIAIRGAALLPPGADLRGSVVRKRYRYLVVRDMLRDPFWRDTALRYPHRLNLEVLRAEAEDVLGTHDFAAFRTSADERTNTVRTMESIRIAEHPGDARVLAIDVVGNAFLHNMVRILVGSLLDVGSGRLARGALSRALQTKKRADLGITAPAHALCLEHIEHTLPIERAWPTEDDG
ncbi:MAG TPA: tRNA pseudouridine(38-40) synthase TruA [Polyangiaceae bacterium]